MTTEYVITALRPRRQLPGHFAVYINGEKCCILTAAVVADLELKPNQCLTESEYHRLLRDGARAAIEQKLDRLLARREYSRKELERKLTDFAPELTTPILDRYEESDFINDNRFARAWRNDRDRFKPCGHYRLVMELRQRGVADDVINELLSGRSETEIERARQALTQGRRRWQGLDREKVFRRATGFLSRRGFSTSVIAAVLREPPADDSGAL